MKAGIFFKKLDPILTPDQKMGFRDYFPQKVYKTERNIAMIVAGTQLCMLLVSACKAGGPFADAESARYFLCMRCSFFQQQVFFLFMHG